MVKVIESVANSGHDFVNGNLLEIRYYTEGPNLRIRITRCKWERDFGGVVSFAGHLHDDNTQLCEGVLDTGTHKLAYAAPGEATTEQFARTTLLTATVAN